MKGLISHALCCQVATTPSMLKIETSRNTIYI